MKKLFFIPFLLLLTAAVYLLDSEDIYQVNKHELDKTKYRNGILNKEYYNVPRVANYDFDVVFNKESKEIHVKEKVNWTNKTKFSTKEVQLHFYSNAYKSNKTLFAKAYHLDKVNKTHIEIINCQVNGANKTLEFFQPEVSNPNDSTVAKIKLDENINPGNSVEFYFEYKLKIPIGVKRFGAASGRNFFFVSQWFPKVGVFENGNWTCSQYHPYLNYYSDFGDYTAKITVPNDFIVASTGVETELIKNGNSHTYTISQSGVHDFVWLTTDNIIKRNEVYKRNDGTQILINAYVQPERTKYFDRYFAVVKNSLKYFEENVGIYPYENISLVDVPRTSISGGMEYPTLFTVSAELFARTNTGWPEYLVAHEFSHQYFQGIIANNEVYEAWFDEGFASYMATKIMYEYYRPILETFKVAQYIPIFGLNFLSYNDIPIIYILTDVHVPEGAWVASNYYKNLNLGTIADTSYKLPTRLSYVVNSYNKPEMVLLTLERYLGKTKMMNILKEYYNQFKFRHPKGKDFIKIVNDNCREDMNWFFDEFYYSSKNFDYRVTSVKKVSDTEYDVLVERLGDGIFKTDVSLITDKNVLTKKWNGVEKWKVFRFNTLNNVLSAEVDLHRKNLLDINFANNSYTMEEKTVASLSIAVRWFFWVQNALMILGSIG